MGVVADTIRVSKRVLTMLGGLVPKDRAILYLYLHALAERLAFLVAPVPAPSTKRAIPVFVCLQCYSCRSKAKGETKLGIHNSGATLAIADNAVYCAACESQHSALCVLDLRAAALQTSTAKTLSRVRACPQCHQLVTTSTACCGASQHNIPLCSCPDATIPIVLQGKWYSCCARHRAKLPKMTSPLSMATAKQAIYDGESCIP